MNKIENFICTFEKSDRSRADTVQIFDSWAGLLPENKIKKFCFEPTKRIVEGLKKLGKPIIVFREE